MPPDTPWTIPQSHPTQATDATLIDDHALAILREPVGRPPGPQQARRVELRAVHVRTVTVVKVPAVKLPPASPQLRRKIRAHFICVVCSGFFLFLASYVTGGALLHLMPWLATAPNGIMETLDRIHDR